jgi:hypothetical protein
MRHFYLFCDIMQTVKFPKTAIAAIAVVLMGVATVQTMSMMSVQSAAAQPTINQGQCIKVLQEELGFTKEDAKQTCKEAVLNQGQCFQLARETGQITEEECRELFSPNPRF